MLTPSPRDPHHFLPRVTQLDVARAAGVHSTTVSLALRNSPSLPASTRRRIQALAEQLGYCPDPALRALVAYRKQLVPTRRTETIAFVRFDGTHSPYREALEQQYFKGAQHKGAESGYQIEPFTIGGSGLTGRRLSSILFHRGIRGMLLAPFDAACAERLDLDFSQLCAVQIGHVPHGLGLHRVANDPIGDIRLAMRRSLAAGYQRIGLVLPAEWDDLTEQAWSMGFTIEQSRVPTSQRIPILVQPSHNRSHSHASSASPYSAGVDPEALMSWYEGFRPEVILGSSQHVLPALEQLRLRIPSDIAFVDLAQEDDGRSLAGVRQSFARVGEVAMEILVGQLQVNARGLPANSTTTLVDGLWCDGASLPGPLVRVVA
jgi:LacI family transcriptional regulator